MSVEAVSRDEVIVSSHFCDRALLKHAYHVRVSYRCQTMGYRDAGPTLLRLVQRCLHDLLAEKERRKNKEKDK